MSKPTDGLLANRLVASAALALYSTAVVIGCVRVFRDWSFFGDLMLIVIVGHGSSLLLRRVNVAVAIVAQAALMTWLLAIMLYPDTLRAGLPSTTTWDTLNLELSVVRQDFPDAVAPVDYATGWAALAAICIAVSVLLADVFAFHARTRFEALVPGGVLFVVVGALGSGRHQVLPPMLIVLAGVLAVAALRAHQVRPPHALVGRAVPPLGRIALGAVPLGVVAALAAGALGPALPGADSEALYDPGGSNSTSIDSPLVDIKSRLVDQSNNVMFTVESTVESYWRLATLSDFNGEQWHLSEHDPESVSGLFRDQPFPDQTTATQTVRIGGLGGRLVPAAAEPYASSGPGLLWSDNASTLYTEEPYRRGDQFQIDSALPRFNPDQLRATSATNAPDDAYLQLPKNFPERARELAQQVTAGAPTDFDAAMALQSWFRNEFSYDLEVHPGTSNGAIEDFLDRRTGYCEQFAGTFAAMARQVGLPARVATGYTAGELDGTGAYEVRGRNAHAWPEVWFDGLGWVLFEPTPGRGAPGAQEYTGVLPQQAGPDEGGGSPSPTTTAPPQQGEEPPPATAPSEVPPRDNRAAPPADGPANEGGLQQGAQHSNDSGVNTTAVAVLLVIGGILVLVAVVPGIVRKRRRDRWRKEPRLAIAHLWGRVQRLYAASGVQLDSSRTPSEFARVAARTAPGTSTEIRALAAVVNQTLYGANDQIDVVTLERCEAWYADIVRSTSVLIPWPQRVWMYLTATD